MHQRKKILWLVSWYPNKYNLFDGDFIQRHAGAVALHHDIHVIFVRGDDRQSSTEEVVNLSTGLTEQIIYFKNRKGPLSKLHNQTRWQYLFRKAAKEYFKKHAPRLIHVHVPWKAGFTAVWLKRTYGVPFAVTEHWDIYNRIVADNIFNRSSLFRLGLKKIYQQAACLISVSDFLVGEIRRFAPDLKAAVVCNVVDTSLFYPVGRKQRRFSFLHVSNMAAKKNAGGILEAFARFLLQTKADARLVLVGNGDDRYQIIARQLNLPPGSVSFKGEVPYSGVAKEMQRCHAFVLASDMENSPCVIGEALCCGLPVIATAVGGIPELVGEENGLLVQPANAQALTQAMMTVFENYGRFNANEIAAAAAKKFSPQAVSAAMSGLYGAL